MNGNQNFSSFLKKLLERDEKAKIRQGSFMLNLNGDVPSYYYSGQRINFK